MQPSTTAMEEEKEYPSVLTLLPKKVHPLYLQVLVEYSDAVAECVAVGVGVAATE